MKINLPDVRLAFAKGIWKPTNIQGGEGGEGSAFNCQFIINPKHVKLVKALDQAVIDVATEKWKDKAEAVLKTLEKGGKIAWQKEDYCNKKTGEPYPGFEDMFHIGARSQVAPLIIDTNKAPLTEKQGKPYAGCYVNAQIELWAQDNQFGRRINAGLKGIQFLRDGDAFGGGAPASADDFDDLSDVGEEDDDNDFA